ncbi:hypothetical protein [Erythrobacter alti]|uniref:hypothetical protein n=1 Tax=Erythrobacter alti TaxID=1896145 RepID=UPI0030F422E1
MRKIILSAAMAGTALTLAACAETADDTVEPTVEETTAADDMVDDAAASSVLDANSATEEQLAAVAGVSPELAAAIVAGQPFASVTGLRTVLVENLGETQAAKVLVNVFVPVNLNTASSEEIELIPGMTDRMVHEFEEYRPYADMAEFDREIGKYVDEEEVARLRNYVTL